MVWFNWFKNGNQNIDSLHFTAKAVSPIWTADGANITVNTKGQDGKEAVHTTIYSQPVQAAGESNTANLSAASFGGTYVAGYKKGEAFKIETVGGTDGSTFGWHEVTDADEKKTFPDYEQPTTATPDSIAHTNVVGGDSTFVVGNKNTLIAVSLDKALDFGWISMDKFINFTADPAGFTYYLTKANWDEIEDIWESYWRKDAKYAGQYVPYGYEAGAGATDQEAQDTIKAQKAIIENLNEDGSSDDDKLTYRKYKYFTTVMNEAKLEHYVTPCYSSDADVEPVDARLTPEEVAYPPFFTCANAGDYIRYVKFNNLAEGAAPDASTHITKVIAIENASGKSTVEIPLTLNVVDKWGMTTKKEFTITVEVK